MLTSIYLAYSLLLLMDNDKTHDKEDNTPHVLLHPRTRGLFVLVMCEEKDKREPRVPILGRRQTREVCEALAVLLAAPRILLTPED